MDQPSLSPFIKKMKIKGLLSFGQEVEVEFGRLNVLVGPNGSGKSNLIDCLRIFRNCPVDIQATFRDGGFGDWVNRFLKADTSANVELVCSVPVLGKRVVHRLGLRPVATLGAGVWESLAELGPDAELWIFNTSEDDFPLTVVWQKPTGSEGVGNADTEDRPGHQEYLDFFKENDSVLAQLRDARQYPEITKLADFYSSIRIYSEWSFGRGSALREASPADGTGAYLSEKLDDLPLALNSLQGTAAHDRIRQLLAEVKPSYSDFITRVVFGRVGLEIKEAPFGTPLPARRLSDGTLRFLALAAILCSPKPPPVVVLEEPELGMHPDMIRLVADMLAEASERTQIIITTHSDHLLTALQDRFDRLLAFDAGPEGSVVRTLTQDDYRKWRANHDLGELWTSGELGGVRY